ncbi:hypothetical protein BJ741DRAFT_580721 [Chytriomyces cf. hyalinus JEL632]|nr:hypothetical protein BJ741DRAFT_580721 [Chytriomyces cf. hyalinus JEL632]
MNALLAAMFLCEFFHAFLIALSNYYYFVDQALGYLAFGVGQSTNIHFAYFRSRSIIRGRVSTQIAQAIRVIAHASLIITPIAGILSAVAFFHRLPDSIIPYSMIASTFFTMGIDLVFIYVFAKQIRAMQSDIVVNPAFIIIARYGLLANIIGIFGIACFILTNVFAAEEPWGVRQVTFEFLIRIVVWLMCMVCLVMKVKLVRLKDNDDCAVSGLAQEGRKLSLQK